MSNPPPKLSLRTTADPSRSSKNGGDDLLVGHTILVVDDNPVNVGVLVGILKSEQCTPISAPAGAPALDLAKKHRPSLILLDIMMPEMDGFAVCRELKRNPGTARIPVIFVTALNDHETKEKARSLGAVDFLEKPISRKHTVERIRKAIVHSSASGEEDPTPAEPPKPAEPLAPSTAPKPENRATESSPAVTAPAPSAKPGPKADSTTNSGHARALDLALRWGLHDIKGAFGGVVGLVDALGQELESEAPPPEPESLREYVGWINEALRNADEATAALGFLRQIIHHTDVPTDCPLYETMLDAVEGLRNGPRAANIELNEEKSSLPVVRHDHELLSGLFLHLFTALLDLLSEGEALHLRVNAVMTKASSVQVTIKANGRSLNKGETELFFEMEKDGKRRSIRGIGLSLLAVQRTLRRMEVTAEIKALPEDNGNLINLNVPVIRN